MVQKSITYRKLCLAVLIWQTMFIFQDAIEALLEIRIIREIFTKLSQ